MAKKKLTLAGLAKDVDSLRDSVSALGGLVNEARGMIGTLDHMMDKRRKECENLTNGLGALHNNLRATESTLREVQQAAAHTDRKHHELERRLGRQVPVPPPARPRWEALRLPGTWALARGNTMLEFPPDIDIHAMRELAAVLNKKPE